MRLDKYLKVARLVRRRSIAKLLADNDKISVNNQIAKPATTVQVGDEIEMIFGERQLKVKVLELTKNPRKDQASLMYEILED